MKYPVTPVGKLSYAYLIEPDTKYNPDGLFHTRFALNIEEAHEIVEQIDEVKRKFAAEVQAKDKNKRAPKEGPLPYQVNQEDMTVVFHFKLDHKKKSRATGEEFTQTPIVKAPDGSTLTLRPNNGSLAKIAYEIVPFYNPALGLGIRLRLRGVKVLQLVEYQGAADLFGDDSKNNEFNPGDF